MHAPAKKTRRIMAIPRKKPHFQAFQAGSRLTIHITIREGRESESKYWVKTG
jgi:hypothetical protein